MTERPASPRSPSGGTGTAGEAVGDADARRFFERLRVPWWYWPPVLGVSALLAVELHMGYPHIQAWLPYLITVPLGVAALVWLGRMTVRVDGDELHAADAHLPLRFIGAVETLSVREKRRALGRDLDPAAFVRHRAWVGPMVRIHLIDPADPTPYWLISVRDADRLRDVLVGTSR